MNNTLYSFAEAMNIVGNGGCVNRTIFEDEVEKALFGGDLALAMTHILPVVLYAVITTVAAVLLFLRQMKRQ